MRAKRASNAASFGCPRSRRHWRSTLRSNEHPAERLLVFCDEDAPLANPLQALAAAPDSPGVSLLIGPEGGFDALERAKILAARNVLRLNLGPRVLRADTAAVAALALIQSRFGDWR